MKTTFEQALKDKTTYNRLKTEFEDGAHYDAIGEQIVTALKKAGVEFTEVDCGEYEFPVYEKATGKLDVKNLYKAIQFLEDTKAVDNIRVEIQFDWCKPNGELLIDKNITITAE